LAVASLLAARPAQADEQMTTGDAMEGVALGAFLAVDLGLTVNNAVNDAPRSPGLLVGELALVTPQLYFAIAVVRDDDWPEQPLASLAIYWLAALETQAFFRLFPPKYPVDTKPDAPLRIGGSFAYIYGCGGGCALDDAGGELRLFVDRVVYRRVIAGGYLATGFIDATPVDTRVQHVQHVEAGAALKLGVTRFSRFSMRLVTRLAARVQFGASDDRWNGADPAFGVGMEFVIRLARGVDLVAEMSYQKVGLDSGADAGVDSVTSSTIGLAF
jgi:hypothetical protein